MALPRRQDRRAINVITQGDYQSTTATSGQSNAQVRALDRAVRSPLTS
jgi:hypothetical protein